MVAMGRVDLGGVGRRLNLFDLYCNYSKQVIMPWIREVAVEMEWIPRGGLVSQFSGAGAEGVWRGCG